MQILFVMDDACWVFTPPQPLPSEGRGMLAPLLAAPGVELHSTPVTTQPNESELSMALAAPGVLRSSLRRRRNIIELAPLLIVHFPFSIVHCSLSIVQGCD